MGNPLWSLLSGGITPLIKTVLDDIHASPELKAQIQEKLADTDAQIIGAVNTTMQAEAKSEHWPQYGWRPAIGFAFAAQTLALGLAFAHIVFQVATGRGLPGDTVVSLSQLIQAMAPLFLAEGGILGVSAGLRGWEKVVAAKGNGKS